MTDTAFPIDVAQIVALFMESMFYGLYLVSFGMCMYTMLIKSRSRNRQRYTFLIVALLLFIFATLDVALLLRHVLDAFIWYHGPGGPIGEFSIISYWVNVMKTVNYVAQTSIADAMLIYRCYIVYGGSWLVATPLILLWIAGMVVEGMTCYTEFTLGAGAFLNAKQLTPLITSIFSITLVLNIIATSLIVYKIWKIERQSRAAFSSSIGSSGTDGLRRAMQIIIESGLMYSVSVFILFVVYVSANNAEYGVSDCVVQIIGIAFNLIIIRIDQGKSVETTLLSRSGNKYSSPYRHGTRRTDNQTTITQLEEGDNRNHTIAMVSFKDSAVSTPDEDGISAPGSVVKAPPMAV